MGIVQYIQDCNGNFNHDQMCQITSHYIMLKKGENIEFPPIMYGKDPYIFLNMFDCALKYFVNGN
jgi:hypothetical protein